MNRARDRSARTATVVVLGLLLALMGWGVFHKRSQPESPRMTNTSEIARSRASHETEHRDAELVRQLMSENLGERRFRFGTVMNAASGHRVLALDPDRPSHRRLLAAIEASLHRATEILSREDSPVRKHRRINEVSSHFEEALRLDLEAVEGLRCDISANRNGDRQRSGYPDLRVVDEATGEVFYLDPKLVERGSWDSSFRSFYFEPKNERLKINDDAVHLLVGIGHDGKSRAWTFGPWKVVDLSTITLRLKPEFQASNRDLYPADDQ